MKAFSKVSLVSVVAVLATLVPLGLGGSAAWANTCEQHTGSAYLDICGVDFTAQSGTTFNGVVAHYVQNCTTDRELICIFEADIDWGDGTTSHVAQPGTGGGTKSVDLYATHTYSVPGYYTVTVLAEEVATTCRDVGCTEFRSGTATADAVVGPLAELGISMSGPATAKTNTNARYDITVRNAGPWAAANVVLTNPLPYGTKFVSATVSQGDCTPLPVVGSQQGTITCSLGSVADNATATATITLKVTGRAGRGVINNTARVSTDTYDPNTGDNTASVSTQPTK
jgi:uncharacterized repeat protein (TIGR01451 family)